jgi:hypothetical protein
LKNQDTHIRWDYRKTDDFVHILSLHVLRPIDLSVNILPLQIKRSHLLQHSNKRLPYKNQDTHIRWDYGKTDDFVHILSNDDKLQHIDGQLSDIDKTQLQLIIYIFDNLYLKSYGILLLLYSLYFYLYLISLII